MKQNDRMINKISINHSDIKKQIVKNSSQIKSNLLRKRKFSSEAMNRFPDCLTILYGRISYKHIGKIFKFVADLTQNSDINVFDTKLLICYYNKHIKENKGM